MDKMLDKYFPRFGKKKDDDDFEEAKHWAINQKQSLVQNKPANN